MVSGFSQAELDVAHAVFRLRGAAHQVLTRRYQDQEIDLDGKVLIDAELIGCHVCFVQAISSYSRM
jgi:hypothetical protein